MGSPSQPRLEVIRGGHHPEGRETALRELYEKYAASVFGRCLFLLKNDSDAEDAMQEVFAKALGNLQGFRGEASPLTWLMKIATHHCLNVHRSRTAGWRGRYERDVKASANEQDGPRLMEARDQVHRQLARFDLETQRAVVHYHIDGMTLEEVAGLLGRSVPTIRKRLAKFARALERDEP